jgi:PAS domain-containing protein
VITKVDIEQRNRYSISQPDKIKNIVLPWYNNFITISFAILDFYDIKENRYKYILEGLEKEWITCSNTNKVTYLNVAPGQYTFRVIGENSDGIRSPNEASLEITIIAPYWQRLWFKCTVITLSFSCMILIFFWRMAIARKQRELLESQVIQRTKELSEKTIALESAHDQLEEKVQKRTHELAATNEELLREITIRKQTEESLRRSEEIARVLINAPVDLSMLIDIHGKILSLNNRQPSTSDIPSIRSSIATWSNFWPPRLPETVINISRNVSKPVCLRILKMRIRDGYIIIIFIR